MTSQKIVRTTFLALFITYSFSSIAQVLEADSLVLNEIYAELGGDNWTLFTNWGEGAVSTWSGVAVTGNRVTGLFLNEPQLRGSLPISTWTLDSLAFIYARGNEVDITITSEIGDLKNLTSLNLREANLVAPLPDELYGLTSLDNLQLKARESDSLVISPDIAQLSNVNTLWLQRFYGALPAEIGQLTNLTSLTFIGSSTGEFRYAGEFPDISKLQKLFSIQIIGWEFENNFFNDLYLNPKLEDITLWNTRFSNGFSVNANIAELPALRDVWLENLNFIDGSELGVFWFQIPSLRELTIGTGFDRQFPLVGAIPDAINTSYLEKVAIFGHHLTSMPEISISTLQELDVAMNKMDFGQLEKNMHIPNYYYNPQQLLGEPSFTIAERGTEHFEVQNSYGGTQNTYTWLKNGNTLGDDPFVTPLGDDLVIYSVRTEDAGAYVLKVQSDSVTDLTLETQPAYLAVNSISLYQSQVLKEDSLLGLSFDLDTLVSFPQGMIDSIRISSADQLVSASEQDRLLTLQWPENYNGGTSIDITYYHPFGTFQDSLLLTVLPVNDAPKIYGLSDTAVMNSGPHEFAFSYGDIDNTIDQLTLEVSVSDPDFLPLTDIVLMSEDGSGVLKVDPVDGESGDVEISLSISDPDSTYIHRFTFTVELPLGGLSQTVLYPNPTSQLLHVNGFESRKYTIYDLHGKEVKKGTITTDQMIDIKELKAGKYVLKIRNQHMIFIKE